MKPYHEALTEAISKNLGCESRFVGMVSVKEVFQGQVAWEGEVCVYYLRNHPKAKRCYAWGHPEGGEWEVTTVLEIPPVVSPVTAVRAAIAATAKRTS